MGRKKNTLPSEDEFYKIKRVTGPKKDPVWVYLDREMRERKDKPYNEIVGDWLQFLKDFSYYKFCEAKRKHALLQKEVGPPWFQEFSQNQRNVLEQLPECIRQDVLEDMPIRVRRALYDLGLEIKFSRDMLRSAMKSSLEDPGLFIWNLYSAYFKESPSVERTQYSYDAKLLMSALVFIDEEECLKELDRVSELCPRQPSKHFKKHKKFTVPPDLKYGMYLQKFTVPRPPFNTAEACPTPKKKPMPLSNKLRLRSEESYEDLMKNNDFLHKRKERSRQAKVEERVCNYKFWEPPTTLRNRDPKLAAFNLKLKMFKKKASAKHQKFKPPYDNMQTLIGNVSYTGGRPSHIVQNVVTLPTGYIPLNMGVVMYMNDHGRAEFITNIGGYWKYPRATWERCDSKCECCKKWEGSVIQYLKTTKCMCGHNYDMYHEGKTKEKYFYQSTRHSTFWIDHAKIYQFDPLEDFIRDNVKIAVKSTSPTNTPSALTVVAGELKEKDLLSAFFADLSDTPLITPHLPHANLLTRHQEFIRMKLKGPRTAKQQRKLKLYSSRRWVEIEHMNFRGRAHFIPFTLKELNMMNFDHHTMIKNLFERLLQNFIQRNRKLQLEQSRLLWRTMVNETYNSKSFMETYFTYMPARLKDTYLLNTYTPPTIYKVGHTCNKGLI